MKQANNNETSAQTGQTPALPRVVIVGRMNVGKSTLFNRLTGSKNAITSSLPGTTRDIHTGLVTWQGRDFELVDTGGLDVEDDEQLEERVIAAARRAMATADVVLFVIDGQAGVLPQDRVLAREIHNSKKPVLLLVNKIDSAKKESELPAEMHQLNFERVFLISAGNGRGTGDMLDGVYEYIGQQVQISDREQRTKVAIIGRPNVGKSSLLNSLLGDERVIVADKAHTTRDTNDIPYDYGDKKFLLIDTAGIRRKANVGERWSDKRLGQIEKESVRAAIQAIERADVVLLVIEAQERVTAQDKRIALLADELGKGLILVVNKWDLIEEKSAQTITEFTHYFDVAFPFLRWVPMIFISAKDGLRVKKVLDVVNQVTENYNRMLTLAELEPIFESVRRNYKPRQSATRKYRKPVAGLKRLKQVGNCPPWFYLKTNKPKDIPAAIPKIIERELRDHFDFDGVKIVIEIGK
ncbi:MAG: ribosome biogenesis GTPase Der [Candidatus Kerfeldbacteria bacterium]|nr:ribosome biogenesis GTPase Der [Candidatus Kerfeldbacteria bacterium]